MHYAIEMKEGSSWYRLGGSYDAATADERILQFMNCYKTAKGGGREFRIVQVASGVKSASAERFEAYRTSSSPR